MSDFDSENNSSSSNSDTETYASDTDESMEVQETTDSENDTEIIESQFTPYTDEPIAPLDYDAQTESDEEDPDGLTPQTLADREDGVIPLANWCKCKHCKTDNLSGALEHRCCMEVLNIQGKLVFDGSIENLECIIQHEEYKAITNKAVLQNVAPLLRCKNGRTYRRRSGVTENEFLRSVAYRWTIRWLCGYMGWENTRPLPACIYNAIRTTYQTRHLQPRGYRQS